MRTPATINQFSTYLALATAIILWGVAFVAVKIALTVLSTVSLVFIRFTLAAIIFVVLFAFFRVPKFTLQEHGKLLCLALFEPGLYFFFETLGLNYISAAKASLIIATVPLAVLILAGLILREKVTVNGLIGIFISLLGISMLIIGEPTFSLSMQGSFIGDICMFAAVFAAAIYMILARHLGNKHSAFGITSMQIIYAAFLYIPVFFLFAEDLSLDDFNGKIIIALSFLVFVTIVAFLCYNFALTRLPASHAAISVNGIPVVTAICAWIVLGEMLTTIQIIGGGLVLLSVVITNLDSKLKTAPEMAG